MNKLSPELANLVRRNATYIGQQLNGSVVVEGRAADLAGLENVEQPGNIDALAVNSEQLIMEYPPGEPPSEKALNKAGFDLLDINHEARFVIVAPVPVPENVEARVPGIQPTEFLALAEVPRVLEISRNVVMTVPEGELKPVIVPAEELKVAVVSSS